MNAGYCHYHKYVLTVRQIRLHGCLCKHGAWCKRFEPNLNHEWWKQRMKQGKFIGQIKSFRGTEMSETMLIYYDDELGDIIADECADCEHSYVDDLYFEWMCRRNRCKYTKAEREEIMQRTKAECRSGKE